MGSQAEVITEEKTPEWKQTTSENIPTRFCETKTLQDSSFLSKLLCLHVNRL